MPRQTRRLKPSAGAVLIRPDPATAESSAQSVRRMRMRRFRNLVIGGIQNKVLNLILLTIILLTAAFTAVSIYQGRMLAQLAAESGENQKKTISEIASSAMDQVVTQSLLRSNKAAARMTDDVFDAAAARVTFLADCATRLFAHAEDYALQPFAPPDPADDGAWTAKTLFADGVDGRDPAVAAKVGLTANLADTMISLCPAFGTAAVYVALPEGVHFYVSSLSSSWLTDGKVRSYDPRERGWYQQAVQAGGLIFTDGEWDAATGAYCVECAMPVFGPEGSLQAVVGTDLFLNDIEAALTDYLVEGEYHLLITQKGRAVLPMQAEAFPMAESDRDGDLRASQNEFLSATVSDALQEKNTGIALGRLNGGDYYMAAASIPSTGWVLLSAFDQSIANQHERTLIDSVSRLQEEATATYQDKMAKTRVSTQILFALMILLTLGCALALGKRIVKPLNTITERISELREGNLEFLMDDAYRTGDEVQALAESFAALSHKTLEYMDTVKRVAAEKERISTELSLATKIQEAMLPHIIPAFPDRADFDIIGSMDPAKEVGGDFYDYFLIDDNHLCMLIADVSGKGVPAALFMMASKIILQSVAMLGGTPAEILTRTNEAICSNNEAQMFVTVWLGILELSTGKLTCANAGHEYPVFKRPGGDFELYKDRHGFVIGGMKSAKYREYEMQLEPGARLFVYTDGVPEASNDRQELFGTERMIQALNRTKDAAPLDLLKNMRKAVDSFVLDAEQFDDLTMMCLEYKGPEAAGQENGPRKK